MKVKLSLVERTINRLFYEPLKTKGRSALDRDVAAAKVLTDAFAEIEAKVAHHDDLVAELGQAKRERDEARAELAYMIRGYRDATRHAEELARAVEELARAVG